MPSMQKVRVKQKRAPAATSLPTDAGFFVDTHGTSEDDDLIDNASSEDEPMPKDETEEKLERLLFGDAAGFHDALREREVEGMDLVPRDSGSEDGERDGEEEEGGLEHVDDADLFFLDSGTAGADVEFPIAQGASDDQRESEPPAAWEDSDDERITVSLAGNNRLRKLRLTEEDDVVTGSEYTRRLRKQFERLHPVPDWANPSNIAGGRSAKRRKTGAQSDDESVLGSDHMDTDEEEEMSLQPLARLLQNAGNLTKGENNVKSGGKRKLRQEVLDIQRMKDVGKGQPSTIESLTFHPHYPLLLSSGPASTLFLHHISPKSVSPNPLLTSLHVRRTPIHTSAFSSPTGNQIYFSGRRRYFHIWDLDTGKVEKVNGPADRKEEQKSMERFKLSPCGRWMGFVGSARKGGGIVTILSTTTLQWVSQVRIDSHNGVADFAWWSDGEGMCVVGKNGEVSEWDGRQKRIVARWIDEGAVGTTVISLGGKSGRTQIGGDRWVAVGSSSGIVNIYDRRPWAAAVAEIEKKSKGKKVDGEEDHGDGQSGIPLNPKPTRMLDQLTTPISHLVFSADGQLLVMASRWKKDALRLIHLPSCTIYKNWPTSNTPFGRISAVAIAPTSDMLAVANEQGKIRLWEIHG
ncbi:U3 small nucleolar RNA-associated protein 18 [Blastomyces parvus]|uniref:U3 small nucleolar RNA-associated protein 18 n=1 Tax=Blastomyces parvus TaxID=2060905 RepID=A0A2B7WVV5_9EURO|nr:U3 small nucleolar RNA-associated protein 18 [Blastomyces parvus]